MLKGMAPRLSADRVPVLMLMGHGDDLVVCDMRRSGAKSNPRFGLAGDKAQIKMVRVVGVEPTLLAEPDFESGASTNSTTPAAAYFDL